MLYPPNDNMHDKRVFTNSVNQEGGGVTFFLTVFIPHRQIDIISFANTYLCVYSKSLFFWVKSC